MVRGAEHLSRTAGVSRDALLDFIRQHTGLRMRAVSQDPALLSACMESEDVGTWQEFLHLLHTDTAALDRLIAALTIGETYFFRDPEHFEFIRSNVLPAFVGHPTPFRAWCAGCASGEEAYSLAMVLHTSGLHDSARVVATDLSIRSLEKARRASYSTWSFRSGTPDIRHRYFREDGREWVLDETIRRRVVFERHNLLHGVFPPLAIAHTLSVDLILCRNVFIYLTPDAIEQIVHKFYRCMNPGAWLVVGPSDPDPSTLAPFEGVTTTHGRFYRKPRANDAQEDWRARLPPPAPTGPDAPRQRSTSVRSHEPAPRLSSVRPSGSLDAGSLDARGSLDDELIHLRALINLAGGDAARVHIEAASRRHPLAPAIHHLHTVVLMESRQYAAALEAARRLVYVGPELAVGHLLLAQIQERLGRLDEARRAYERTVRLAARMPADAIVSLTDGMPVDSLVRVATAQLARLDAAGPNARDDDTPGES